MTAPGTSKPWPIGWWVKRSHTLFPDPIDAALTAAAPTIEVAALAIPAGATPALTPSTPDVYVYTQFDIIPGGISSILTGAAPQVTPIYITLYPTNPTRVLTGKTPTVRKLAVQFNTTAGNVDYFGGNPISVLSGNATAGDYAVVDYGCDNPVTITGATYNGVAMTLLAAVTGGSGHGYMARYGIANVPSGQKTVTISHTGSSGQEALYVNTYKHVASVDTSTTTNPSSGTTQGQNITVPADGMAVCAITAYSYGINYSSSGGTNRQTNLGGSTAISVNDASTSTNFTGTSSSSASWGTIATVLRN